MRTHTAEDTHMYTKGEIQQYGLEIEVTIAYNNNKSGWLKVMQSVM